VVGSVVVTNLATGKRCGGWESAEVREKNCLLGMNKYYHRFERSPYPLPHLAQVLRLHCFH